VTSDPATLTVWADVLVARYQLTTLCPTSTIALPTTLSFTEDGLAANTRCAGQRSFRLFAGRVTNATGKITRIRQNCTVAQFGPTLCGPESVLIDVHGRWPVFPSGIANLLIVGGACNSIYFINPASGAVIETFDDPSFEYIGQMAIDSMGRLFVGSLNGDALNVIDMGVTEPFWFAPGQSPRAVALDADDNVYLTCSVDGVLRKLDPLGDPINAGFATGLQGAISQAFAPPGIFHGNLFVACGDRVMEVDRTTGATSTFMSCRQGVWGIAFDPDGFMYVSEPSQNHIYKIGPGLPGDMNGDGVVNLTDLPAFVAALLQHADALLPIVTADMNGDGCADGADIQPFINALIVP
jgi:WD40 repeat protein